MPRGGMRPGSDSHCEEGGGPTKQSYAQVRDCFGVATPRNDTMIGKETRPPVADPLPQLNLHL
jgi:hypothetical protein